MLLVNRLLMTLVFFVMFSMSGCGGGGGGGDDGGDNVDPGVTLSPAEGLYSGTTSTGRYVTGIILNDNTYYFLYSFPGVSNVIGGVVQGKLTLNNGTFVSNNARDFNLEGSGVLPATIEGTYVEKQSSSGLVLYPTLNESTGFNMVYDVAYELTPSLATINGNYSGEVVTSQGWENANLTISPTGIISGVGDSGCTVSGVATTRASGNVYDISLTFGGAPCVFANQTLRGISYFDAPDKWLYGVALNGTRTDGVLFTGQQNTSPSTDPVSPGQCVGQVIDPINLTIGTPLNESIDAFDTKFYVFDVFESAAHTISLYNMTTDNDWALINYISPCEDDYPVNPPIIAESSNLSTNPDIKTVSLNPGRYLLVVDEWDNLPSSYTVSVTR